MSVLGLFLGGGLALANCQPAYERFAGRAIGGAVVSSSVGALSTVGAYPTLAFGLLGSAVLKSDAIMMGAFLLTGTELALGAGLSGTGTVLLVRRHSYNKVLHLIEDAELGGGPALSAYVADLTPVGGGTIPPGNVVMVVGALNAEEAFCGPEGLLTFDEADALIRARLTIPPTDSALAPNPGAMEPALP